MEIGRIADIDAAKTNHIEKIQTVKEVDNKHKVFEDEQYKKVQGKPVETNLNEVILDNVKFGYNKNSQDFFIKIARGGVENKYPTEDMMRIKAQLLSEIEAAALKS